MFRFVFAFLALTQVAPLFSQNTTIAEVNLGRKLSPGTQLFLQHPEDKFLFYPDANGRVPALVQLEDASKLPKVPAALITGFGNILSVRLNKEEMMVLANDKNVVWIDVSF